MYVKIHDSIFGSSIMEEDIEIRYIWLCMLTIADFEGFVDETIPALARRFNISENKMVKAIQIFLNPDPSSRTIDNDGRRIEPMRPTFGWHIINYEKYRDMRNTEERKEYMRKYMKGYMRNYRKKEDKEDTVKHESLTDVYVKQVKPKQKQKQKQNNKDYVQKTMQMFMQFWEVYPKKKAKKDAQKAFLTLFRKNNTDLHSILYALEEMKKSEDWLKDDGQFIPLPATWLRGERWKDEIVMHDYDAQAKAFIERHKNDKEA